MARPTKEGLEYFPLNTKNDDKFDLIEARHGLIGFAIIIKLFQRIYDDKGYFYPWGEKQKLLFSRSISTAIDVIDMVISSAVEFGLFDENKFKKGLLTSRGIQRRYFEASKKRRFVTLYTDVLLITPVLGEKQTACEMVFTGNNSQTNIVITVNNPYTSVVSSGNNPQSKEESKEERSGGNAELIPVITHHEEPENTTTFSVSEIQEEVRASTGYLIDAKIAQQFQNLNLSQDSTAGPLSFYAYANEVVKAKYPAKAQHEHRTIFIAAVTEWENLQLEYPTWVKKKKAELEKARQTEAKQTHPKTCDCGGEISAITGKFVCENCKAIWYFSEGEWNKLDHDKNARIDFRNAFRKKNEEITLPDVF